jgi:8-oxo-dGTP diphosphatase
LIQIKEISAVIGFPIRKKTVLLAEKQSKVGKGLYMPYGGMIESGETAEEAMVRELEEESRMTATVDDLEKVGTLIRYEYLKGRLSSKLTAPIYLIHFCGGKPTDTKEMKGARWFPRSKRKLPLSRMLPADRIWIPKVLAGKYVTIYVAYDELMAMQLLHPPSVNELVTRSPRPR